MLPNSVPNKDKTCFKRGKVKVTVHLYFISSFGTTCHLIFKSNSFPPPPANKIQISHYIHHLLLSTDVVGQQAKISIRWNEGEYSL